MLIMLFLYKLKFIVKSKQDKAIVIIGKEIITPYLTNCPNEYFTPCLFTKFVNIIPARAPIGVKKAPILLPMIEA